VPRRIKHQPDEILDIVLSTAAEDSPDDHTQANSTLTSADDRDVTNGATVPSDSTNPSSSTIDKLSESISDLAITPLPALISVRRKHEGDIHS